MANFRIQFLPDDREAVVDEGTSLLSAARAADVYVGAICGGEGICGKCRVIVRKGEVEGESIEFLTRDEIRRGYVLACQVVPRSDLVVEVPPESRLGGYQEIGHDSERFRDFAHRGSERQQTEIDPLVEKYPLSLSEPSLENATGDQERLLSALADKRSRSMQMGLKISRELPRILRTLRAGTSSWSWNWDGDITATVGSRDSVDEVLFVEKEDTSDRNFGVALDIGTTTVVAHLVDLTTGITRDAAAMYNSQLKFGADVINRINHARRPSGAEELHRSIIQDVEVLIDELIQRSKVGRGDISCVVAAGNTTMLHFLLDLEADLIRLSPFVPAATKIPPLRAAELGVRIHPRGLLYTLPMVGSYVGGDITAGILASGIHRSDKLSLLLDVGTNGEVVLGNKDFLVACSASAGPAFEGGSISCGMRATSGAIDTVRIFRNELAVSATTIDGSPPVGMCGTGLIDALAQMFLAGVVDRSGGFQIDRASSRFQTRGEDDRPQFLLVSAKESGSDRDVVISQADVENLIRTKGAIYAAADSLIQGVGISFDEIERVYIAGGFGNRLDISSCITIGLLPDVPTDRVRFIGNASVAGTKMVMRSRSRFDQVRDICDRITYQELIVDPSYIDKFTSACFLPHTDLGRFPAVAEKLEAQVERRR